MLGRLLLVVLLAVASSASAQSIRVATYNVAGGTRDVAATSALISSQRPDVLALQELSASGADRLDQALAAEFPFRVFPAPSQGGGLALAARRPLLAPRYRPSREGINGFLFAELEVDGRRIQIANLHLDPLKTWTWRLRLTLPWQLLGHGFVHRRELEQVWKELRPQTCTLVVGDLNSYGSDAAPDWLRARGLIDSFASVVANADDAATHHFVLGGIPYGERIDFLFHTADLRTLDSRIVAGAPSDHDLVVSRLVWTNR